jgi:plasmid stabilization system protein ParE
MKVSFHPKVPNEVRAILDYYEDISRQLADEFWLELNSAIQNAESFPYLHHFDPSGRRRINLKKFPYHLLFRVIEQNVRITVVKHNSRHPNLGTGRA